MSSTRQHIHVVGFKRSGTTLMQQLFRCFKDTYVPTAGGIHLWDFPVPPEITKGTVVTKFSKDAYFVDRCIKEGAKVLYMLRDPRDTLLSKFNKTGKRAVDPEKLAHRINILNASEQSWNSSVMFIYYEELVEQPDVVQNVLAKWLDLEIDIPFSEGHTRMLDDTPHQALNGVRPVDTHSIGRWKAPEYREEIEETLSRYPEIQEFIRRWYPDV